MNRVSIASLEDPRLDPYRDLKRTNAIRNRDWIIAEGRLVVERLLASDFDVVSVAVRESRVAAISRSVRSTTLTLIVPDKLMEQLVGFKFHSGVIACGRRKAFRDIEHVEVFARRQASTLVACPFIALPENMGLLIRLCAGFEIDGMLIGPRSVDPFYRRSVRVSMGNVFRLPILQTNDIFDGLRRLRGDYGYELVAVDTAAQSQPLQSVSRTERTCLVFGNEADGIQPEVLAICDRTVEIPMSKGVDSLNVATAAAIVLHYYTRVLCTADNNA